MNLTNIDTLKSILPDYAVSDLSNSPMTLQFEFDFDVDMFDDTRPSVKEASRAEILKAAARWYESFAEEQAEVEETPLEFFKYVKPSTVRMKFSNIEEKHKSTMIHVIMDPDEDGNHPLEVNGKLYTVTAVSKPRIQGRN